VIFAVRDFGFSDILFDFGINKKIRGGRVVVKIRERVLLMR